MPGFEALTVAEKEKVVKPALDLSSYVKFLEDAKLEWPYRVTPEEGETTNMVKRRLRKAADTLKDKRSIVFHRTAAGQVVVSVYAVETAK